MADGFGAWGWGGKMTNAEIRMANEFPNDSMAKAEACARQGRRVAPAGRRSAASLPREVGRVV